MIHLWPEHYGENVRMISSRTGTLTRHPSRVGTSAGSVIRRVFDLSARQPSDTTRHRVSAGSPVLRPPPALLPPRHLRRRSQHPLLIEFNHFYGRLPQARKA